MRARPVLLAILGGLFILGGFAAPVAAQAPEKIRAEVLMVDRPLVESETDLIRRYVERWAGQLIAGRSPQSVAAARTKLLDPSTNRLATDYFREGYSAAAATALAPGLSEDNPIVRFNALIVAGEIGSRYMVDLFIEGFDDANAAVRYWAARAVAMAMEPTAEVGTELTAEDQSRVLTAVTGAMEEEQSPLVIEQMYRALSRLTIAEARTAVLDKLEQRLSTHRAGLTNGLRADLEGLRGLQTQLIVLGARGEDVLAPMKRLAAIAGKYLLVVGEALHGGQVGADVRPVGGSVIETGEQILKSYLDMVSDLDVSQSPIVQPLKQGQLDQMMLHIFDWVGGENSPGILTIHGEIDREALAPPAPEPQNP